MNFSSLFGVLFGLGILVEALRSTIDNLEYFLDYHSLLIVFGGTLAAASISFPIKDVANLLRIFFLRVLGRHSVAYQETIRIFLELNKKAGNGITTLADEVNSIKHEFLKEAITLVSGGILQEAELKVILEQRLRTVENRYYYEANMFRTIGRFPPAFGLMATTLGMIALLQKIGQPDSQKLIGPAMSIGLLGTLYGITLTNLVLHPIAENLTELTHEEINLRRMMIEGALLLKAQTNPVVMRERLNSYLLPRYRVQRKVTKVVQE